MDDRQSTALERYDEQMAVRQTEEGNGERGQISWFDPREAPFRLSGFPWFSSDGIYRRLPRDPSEKLPEAVNWLADCTAGGTISFATDAEEVHIRAVLKEGAGMYHMAPSGQSGFDCYAGEPGRQVHAGTASFRPGQTRYASLLFRGDRKQRQFTIHFPLYQGVDEVYIGLAAETSLTEPLPYDSGKKVVFYGTSITQGGCASRPGMAYPAQLGRGINLEVVNLGFSGSGKGEPELARLIAEIHDPAVLVLDYEANCGGLEGLKSSLPAFISIYRAVHRDVPILVVSRITPPAVDLDGELKQSLAERRRFQAELVGKLRHAGDERLFFVDGSKLLGDRYGDSTVDGVHPTDFGFAMMAEKLLPELLRALECD